MLQLTKRVARRLGHHSIDRAGVVAAIPESDLSKSNRFRRSENSLRWWSTNIDRDAKRPRCRHVQLAGQGKVAVVLEVLNRFSRRLVHHAIDWTVVVVPASQSHLSGTYRIIRTQ